MFITLNSFNPHFMALTAAWLRYKIEEIEEGTIVAAMLNERRFTLLGLRFLAEPFC